MPRPSWAASATAELGAPMHGLSFHHGMSSSRLGLCHQPAVQHDVRQPLRGGSHGSIMRKRTRCSSSHAYAASAVAQHRSSREQQHQASLQVVGIGRCGAEGLQQLSGTLPGAQFWRLDENGRELVSGTLPAADTRHSVPAAAAALNRALQQQRRQQPLQSSLPAASLQSGFAGLSFVLTSATDNTADGCAAALDFVQHAVSNRTLAVAAVTMPFRFSSARKQQAAEALISALKASADVVVVVDQNKLCMAMPVAEALVIANQALAGSVQAIVDAVNAPQLLHTVAGMERWYGCSEADGFASRCSLFQQLFADKAAVQGRGQTQMARSAVHSNSLAALLGHMAADATHFAAMESPFLNGQLADSDRLLCCISMPSTAELGAGVCTPADDMQYQRDVIQAARGMLGVVLQGSCSDIAVCCYHRDGVPEDYTSGDHLRVEVSLLVAMHPTADRPQQVQSPMQQLHSVGRSIMPADAKKQARHSAMSALAGGSDVSRSASQPHQPAFRRQDAMRQALEHAPVSQTSSDALIDSLMSLSLDLPPQAARWRKQQRSHIGPAAGATLMQQDAPLPKGTGEDSDEEEGEQPRGLLRKLFSQHANEPPSIQLRTAGILSADRRESDD